MNLRLSRKKARVEAAWEEDEPSSSSASEDREAPEPAYSSDEDSRRSRTAISWTGALESRFLKALHQAGGVWEAKPKAILQRMGTYSTQLTTIQVKSHLQKHRIKVAAQLQQQGLPVPTPNNGTAGATPAVAAAAQQVASVRQPAHPQAQPAQQASRPAPLKARRPKAPPAASVVSADAPLQPPAVPRRTTAAKGAAAAHAKAASAAAHPSLELADDPHAPLPVPPPRQVYRSSQQHAAHYAAMQRRHMAEQQLWVAHNLAAPTTPQQMRFEPSAEQQHEHSMLHVKQEMVPAAHDAHHGMHHSVHPAAHARHAHHVPFHRRLSAMDSSAGHGLPDHPHHAQSHAAHAAHSHGHGYLPHSGGGHAPADLGLSAAAHYHRAMDPAAPGHSHEPSPGSSGGAPGAGEWETLVRMEHARMERAAAAAAGQAHMYASRHASLLHLHGAGGAPPGGPMRHYGSTGSLGLAPMDGARGGLAQAPTPPPLATHPTAPASLWATSAAQSWQEVGGPVGVPVGATGAMLAPAQHMLPSPAAQHASDSDSDHYADLGDLLDMPTLLGGGEDAFDAFTSSLGSPVGAGSAGAGPVSLPPRPASWAIEASPFF